MSLSLYGQRQARKQRAEAHHRTQDPLPWLWHLRGLPETETKAITGAGTFATKYTYNSADLPTNKQRVGCVQNRTHQKRAGLQVWCVHPLKSRGQVIDRTL